MSLYNYPKKELTYVAIIKLGENPDKATRLYKVQAVKDTLDKLSNGKLKLFYNSESVDSFGIFLTSKFNSMGLVKTLYGETDLIQTSALSSSDDSVFITETTKKNWASMGFSNGWRWLEHQ